MVNTALSLAARAKANTMVVGSAFREVDTNVYFHLHPKYIGNTEQGVRAGLAQYIMSYVEAFRGIVIDFHDVRNVTRTGKMVSDSAYAHFFVSVKFLIFSPREGHVLRGVLKNIGKDHVAVLVYGVFNAMIPEESIPEDMVEGMNVGTEVEFTVTRIQAEDGIIAITGTLENGRIVKAAPTPDPESEEETQDNSIISQEDQDGPVASESGSQDGAAEKTTQAIATKEAEDGEVETKKDKKKKKDKKEKKKDKKDVTSTDNSPSKKKKTKKRKHNEGDTSQSVKHEKKKQRLSHD